MGHTVFSGISVGLVVAGIASLAWDTVPLWFSVSFAVVSVVWVIMLVFSARR